jgi:hypothetical protein
MLSIDQTRLNHKKINFILKQSVPAYHGKKDAGGQCSSKQMTSDPEYI